jgi:hypothetical protein
MAIKFSKGLRDMQAGLEAVIEAICAGADDTLTIVDNGASPDSITRVSGSFVTDGFVAGHKLKLFQPTTGANATGITGQLLASVAALTLTFPTGTVDTGEVFAADTVLAAAKGGSLKDIFKNGCLWILAGSQPASADLAFSGTQLVKVTESGNAFSHGAEANGLELGAYAGGYIQKCGDETWQGEVLAAGIAGHFILVGNPTDALSASTTLPRISGSVGTIGSGADMELATTTLVAGRTQTIDTFKMTLPAYYGA